VLRALRLDHPAARRLSYARGFIAKLAAPGARIRAVNVHKRGRATPSAGAWPNSPKSWPTARRRARSPSIEDAAAVVAPFVTWMGGYTNTSYPRGLAALINGEPSRYAVIDVGTNSVKFHLGERERDGKWRTAVDRAEMTRLGEGLEQHNVIGDAALERPTAAIAGMVDEAKRREVLAIAAVGTAGLRIASNRDAVLASIEARTGLRIEVISGDEEGRLAYVAATSGLGLSAGSLVVFDTGGGSSQFTFGHDSSVDERFSVNVGAVRYTERFKLMGCLTRALRPAR
jgi:exopolyphosphatase/guanosine-5'-triphosphate,3'-diphosphate pyrophosphatase